MGKRGPKPQPTALKIAKGTRKSRINAQEPNVASGPPVCPAFVAEDADARAEWDRMLALLEPAGVLTPLDGPALANYCRMFSLALKAQRQINDDGLTAPTDAGGVKPSPVVNVLLSASAQMDRVLCEFGMTPSSRSRVNALANGPKDELAEFLSQTKAR